MEVAIYTSPEDRSLRPMRNHAHFARYGVILISYMLGEMAAF